VHALVYGKPLGLSDEQLVATAHRRADDPAWSARDALLVRFADELQDTCGVSDGVWSALAELYRDDQLLELVISVGWYRLVSYVINAVRIASPGPTGERTRPLPHYPSRAWFSRPEAWPSPSCIQPTEGSAAAHEDCVASSPPAAGPSDLEFVTQHQLPAAAA
jgi:hypothetical protein